MSHINATQAYPNTGGNMPTDYSQMQTGDNYAGYTAMWLSNHWYPDWHAFSYQWDNRDYCWTVWMRNDSGGNNYQTIYIGRDYSWHYHVNGFYQNGYKK